LLVSESTDGEVEVWNAETMQFIRKWSVPRPGPIAVAGDHTVWVISRRDGESAASILHYSEEGVKLPEVITGPPGFDPTAIWFDPATERLLVADNGPEQNIKIYKKITASRDRPDSTFGTSVFAGKAGQITPTTFGSSGLTGVAVDRAGNIYVSMNGVGPVSYWHGGGTVLESWKSDGTLRWRKLGLAFVDCADADPASDKGTTLDVHDKYSLYRLDLSKTAAGSEWSYAGHTLNQFKYPADQRFARAADGWDYTGGTFVRNIGGRRLLYLMSMQARRLLIYRFAEDAGATAIPSGIWESQYGYKAGYPGGPSTNDFIWRDANGNGAFDEAEFVNGPGMPNLGLGMWVDAKGDLWSCNHWTKSGVGIRRWKMQGFDEHGNPIYDYSPGNYIEYQRPEGSHGELRRIEYYPESDTLYVSSTSKVDGDRDAGNRIVKYPQWSTKERSVEWTLDPPMDKTKISSISVAGDYLFLGYSYFGTNGREGTIHVYQANDASYVGEIRPTPAVGSISGTFDIPYAIRAFQRKDGEYFIFAEDDHYAKIIMHRWNPKRPTSVDTLEDLGRTDVQRSSTEWDIDQSNPWQFYGDKARVRRTSDTTQFLVWRQTALKDFSAAIYFDSKLKIDHLVTFAASADGTRWTPLRTQHTGAIVSGGAWSVTNFSPPQGTIPPGTSFLRLQIEPAGTSWNVQLGRLELHGGAEK
jgi:hypothetical protein